jgi:hypothetical protein
LRGKKFGSLFLTMRLTGVEIWFFPRDIYVALRVNSGDLEDFPLLMERSSSIHALKCCLSNFGTWNVASSFGLFLRFADGAAVEVPLSRF